MGGTHLKAFAPGLNLRTLLIDGHPWFVAKDVCDALGIINSTTTLAGLDDDERDYLDIAKVIKKAGTNKRLIVNESGLYSLILRSRKPEAKAFKKWVTSVVLPAIRKEQ